MHRVYLLAFAFCLAGLALGVQAQPRLYGCSRSGFETYSEVERRPAIKYLDAARELADKSVKLFVQGQIGELYSGMLPAFKESNSEKDLREKFSEYEGQTGKVLDYEYRDQFYTFADPSNIDLRRGWATTRYQARTSGWDGVVVIEVHTAQIDGAPLLAKIDILRWDVNVPIDKIFPKATGEGCPWVHSPLDIKPIN